jgi:hypothetical protein
MRLRELRASSNPSLDMPRNSPKRGPALLMADYLDPSFTLPYHKANRFEEGFQNSNPIVSSRDCLTGNLTDKYIYRSEQRSLDLGSCGSFGDFLDPKFQEVSL